MSTNSPKNRDYFITVNESAECFNNVRDIIKSLNYTLYALILHDKDFIEEIIEETGETLRKPKKPHIHIMIELKNPISFSSIQNKFKGAHIETPNYKKSAYQYLLHNSKNSKEKYQYDFNELESNSLDQVKFIIESETFELFYENQFVKYIAQEITTSYRFAKRFGLNAYKQYWKPYNEMLEAYKNGDEEIINDVEQEKMRLNELDLPF